MFRSTNLTYVGSRLLVFMVDVTLDEQILSVSVFSSFRWEA